MRVKSFIRCSRKSSIKHSLRDARLIPGDEQSSATTGIKRKRKRKRNSPNTIARIKPKLFDVGVPRTFQSIHVRAAEGGTKPLQQERSRK
jgi:hypothetical protein